MVLRRGPPVEITAATTDEQIDAMLPELMSDARDEGAILDWSGLRQYVTHVRDEAQESQAEDEDAEGDEQ